MTARRTTAAAITPRQRKALFAAARARGLSTDDLRGMTPGGSISMLTCAQAAALLERINGGGSLGATGGSPASANRPGATGGSSASAKRHRGRAPKGVTRLASLQQHRYIAWLRDQLGWSQEGLDAWLARRHHADGRPLTSIDTARDASNVIGLLKNVLKKSRAEPRPAVPQPPPAVTPNGVDHHADV